MVNDPCSTEGIGNEHHAPCARIGRENYQKASRNNSSVHESE